MARQLLCAHQVSIDAQDRVAIYTPSWNPDEAAVCTFDKIPYTRTFVPVADIATARLGGVRVGMLASSAHVRAAFVRGDNALLQLQYFTVLDPSPPTPYPFTTADVPTEMTACQRVAAELAKAQGQLEGHLLRTQRMLAAAKRVELEQCAELDARTSSRKRARVERAEDNGRKISLSSLALVTYGRRLWDNVFNACISK
jgi:hypothetical protein